MQNCWYMNEVKLILRKSHNVDYGLVSYKQLYSL